jgi:hypothetical protein
VKSRILARAPGILVYRNAVDFRRKGIQDRLVGAIGLNDVKGHRAEGSVSIWAGSVEEDGYAIVAAIYSVRLKIQTIRDVLRN